MIRLTSQDIVTVMLKAPEDIKSLLASNIAALTNFFNEPHVIPDAQKYFSEHPEMVDQRFISKASPKMESKDEWTYFLVMTYYLDTHETKLFIKKIQTLP